MQPRLRGMTLMALSNKFGRSSSPPETRANSRSAIAPFTATCAAALRSSATCRKPSSIVSRVDQSRARNHPRSTIEKPPTRGAEARPARPGFAPALRVLDPILQLYVEENQSAREIVARGFDEKVVRWIQRRVDLNEYKHAPPRPA